MMIVVILLFIERKEARENSVKERLEEKSRLQAYKNNFAQLQERSRILLNNSNITNNLNKSSKKL